ncbi:hypothetical protein JTE90_015004 [Oedothorax gibbosus]|uniref:Secreted protein n=1 Tax=Oedothorax gibbosus TaxID=931172 RepID=A0AAV6TVB9_9ARAC|nr:hypothetical protein JTE90_015004 [Oedothorax gibbosus]
MSNHFMTLSKGCVFILCVREHGFTLTNGFASHCEDACSDVYKRLKYVLLCLEVGQVICADTLTYNVLKAAIHTSSS